MDKQDEQWVRVDIKGLTAAVTEAAWKEETRSIDAKDLYYIEVDDQGKVSKEVTRYWSEVYWKLYQGYEALIWSFCKPETDADIEKRTPTGPEGADL